MHHVERGDRPAPVSPHHRALGRILDGISPDLRIEVRHAHPDHPVTPVALRERVAEDRVQRRNLLQTRGEWSLHGDHRAPAPRARHQLAIPTLTAASSASSTGAGSTCVTTEQPLSSS